MAGANTQTKFKPKLSDISFGLGTIEDLERMRTIELPISLEKSCAYGMPTPDRLHFEEDYIFKKNCCVVVAKTADGTPVGFVDMTLLSKSININLIGVLSGFDGVLGKALFRRAEEIGFKEAVQRGFSPRKFTLAPSPILLRNKRNRGRFSLQETMKDRAPEQIRARYFKMLGYAPIGSEKMVKNIKRR
ncbi:MAG: hypothetical protein NTY48_02080 [Candidatus Diapherotrites archaeon]|nr:hypothetical protein [Candidatus Woesebacteria bacterium]MCX6803339.1 hypothetical protein [Candidatus Diapherotrites archaeon]